MDIKQLKQQLNTDGFLQLKEYLEASLASMLMIDKIDTENIKDTNEIGIRCIATQIAYNTLYDIINSLVSIKNQKDLIVDDEFQNDLREIESYKP